jgi:Flp pilus assembly protein TadD
VDHCAEVALARGDERTALARATRLLEASPKLVAPLRTRAHLRWQAGDAAAALADLDRALAAEPGDAMALNQRAWMRVALGDFERGRADADRAVAAAPGWVAALGTRCFALAGLERREEARRDCARAIELAPPGLPEDRGMVAFLDGDLAGAARLWTEAARTRPREARALAPWLKKAGAKE